MRWRTNATSDQGQRTLRHDHLEQEVTSGSRMYILESDRDKQHRRRTLDAVMKTTLKYNAYWTQHLDIKPTLYSQVSEVYLELFRDG